MLVKAGLLTLLTTTLVSALAIPSDPDVQLSKRHWGYGGSRSLYGFYGGYRAPLGYYGGYAAPALPYYGGAYGAYSPYGAPFPYYGRGYGRGFGYGGFGYGGRWGRFRPYKRDVADSTSTAEFSPYSDENTYSPEESSAQYAQYDAEDPQNYEYSEPTDPDDENDILWYPGITPESNNGDEINSNPEDQLPDTEITVDASQTTAAENSVEPTPATASKEPAATESAAPAAAPAA